MVRYQLRSVKTTTTTITITIKIINLMSILCRNNFLNIFLIVHSLIAYGAKITVNPSS